MPATEVAPEDGSSGEERAADLHSENPSTSAPRGHRSPEEGRRGAELWAIRDERRRVPADESGFTLLELLVVLLVISILLAIAVPTFLGLRNRAWDAQATSNVRNALTAQRSRYLLEGAYTESVPELEVWEPGLSWGESDASKGGVVATLLQPLSGEGPDSDGSLEEMDAEDLEDLGDCLENDGDDEDGDEDGGGDDEGDGVEDDGEGDEDGDDDGDQCDGGGEADGSPGSQDDQAVCLQSRSRSGTTFTLVDVAVGADAGTHYGTGPCPSRSDVGAWPRSAW